MKIQNIKYVIPANKFTPGKFVRGYDAYVGLQWLGPPNSVMLRTSFSIILLACCFICLLNTGIINSVHAAQENTNELLQHDPQKISGKVTDVISAAGFTYAEVDTGKEKVWAAGPGITPLGIGDIVTFSTEMPMHLC